MRHFTVDSILDNAIGWEQKEFGENGYIFVKNNFSADRYGGEIYRRFFDIKDVPSPPASPLLSYMVMMMDQVIHSEKLQLEKLKKQVVDSDSQIQMLEQMKTGDSPKYIASLMTIADNFKQLVEPIKENQESQSESASITAHL